MSKSLLDQLQETLESATGPGAFPLQPCNVYGQKTRHRLSIRSINQYLGIESMLFLRRPYLALLLLLPLHCLSQIPPAGCYPLQAWARTNCAMPTDSGGLVLGCGGFYADTLAALIKVDAQGKWVSRTVSPRTYGADIVMAMPLSDGGSLTVTRYIMCDVGSPDSLHRYWPDGSLRWAIGSLITHVLELEDSSLLVYPGDIVGEGLILHPNGMENDTFSGVWPPYPILGMAVGNYRDFFVAGEDRIIAMRENQPPWSDPWEYIAWESAFRFPITDFLRVNVCLLTSCETFHLRNEANAGHPNQLFQ